MTLAPTTPLTQQSVLVTGGTGAFGRAFVRRALKDGARRVVVFSRGEAAQAAMRAEFHDARIRFALGDVRDATRISDACRGVDVVIHAAAQKRVESCEADPWESIQTNVIGTQHVARACIERGITQAVLLSTDKAAAPNTIYGTGKLAAERLWLGANVYAAGTPTRFSATRYGNVLGSTGSVVPIWRAQAAAGRILTVTDERCTRFWMHMDDAVDLVLLALRNMRGGEIFIPRIGASSISQLAEAIAPGAPLQHIGLRPGEKLHETLITSDEAATTYRVDNHYVIEPPARPWGELPEPEGRLMPDNFTYRSDTAPRYTIPQLREMIA